MEEGFSPGENRSGPLMTNQIQDHGGERLLIKSLERIRVDGFRAGTVNDDLDVISTSDTVG